MADSLSEGDVVAGKYKLDRLLGKGATSAVFAATHTTLGQKVAIKLLDAGLPPEHRARFMRAARASVRLKSEHVAKVLDVSELSDGRPFMVMELLEGRDLASEIRERKRLPVAEAARIIIEACDAIAEAHATGIVHREIEPANLFVLAGPGGPHIKVMDFGLSTASLSDTEGLALTEASAVLGSPYYMSPEQMRNAHDVDGRTDLWALGAILYELVTGRPPYQAPSFPMLVLKVANEAYPLPSTFAPDLPPGLEGVILKCLSKPREGRVQTAADLASMLAPFAGDEGFLVASRIARASGSAMPEKSVIPRASDPPSVDEEPEDQASTMVYHPGEGPPPSPYAPSPSVPPRPSAPAIAHPSSPGMLAPPFAAPASVPPGPSTRRAPDMGGLPTSILAVIAIIVALVAGLTVFLIGKK